MKEKLKVFGVEDEKDDKILIGDILGMEDCDFYWATEDALEGTGTANYSVALQEIQKVRPDCIIVDLALTDKQLQIITGEVGKEFPFAGMTTGDFGGGLGLISELLKNDILSWEKIFVFTEYSRDQAVILTRLIKYLANYEIPVLQKRDMQSHIMLRQLVYQTKGIRVKYVYTLIGQSDAKDMEKINKDLQSVSDSLGIKWINIPRMSLENAKEFWQQDKSLPFDLAFIDLSLNPSDRRILEEMKGQYLPKLSIESFSSLKFAKEFKDAKKSCPLVFLSDIEHRSLVIFLLSPEVNGDWVIKKETLTKSLVALIIKLFILRKE
jgi:CheY-like chemotaxis protein